MAGLPPPISYRKVISSLFQNLRYDYDRSATEAVIKTFYFAAGALDAEQAAQIIYPEGFTPLNRYIIYQINLTQDQYRIRVVAFAEKDGYVYGIYYAPVDAPKYKRRYIRNSPHPISLPAGIILKDHLYLELYTRVESTPVILGLDRKGDKPQASLQYGLASRYFGVNIDSDGIVQPPDPEVRKTGLSRSLRAAGCDC